MTYDGPPCQAELRRNQSRKDYNRGSFEFGYEVHGDTAIENGAGIRRRKDLNHNYGAHHQHDPNQ